MKPVLSDDAFTRLRGLLAGRAGLVFDESRRDSLSYAVADRMLAAGIDTVDAYLRWVEQPASPEVQGLLDDVIIPETYFFRNPPQFRALRDQVLPELLEAGAQNGRRIRIWSAGCSTGEEAYSVAIQLRELLPSLAGWDIKILGTDLSTRSLAAAQAGRYGARALGKLDQATLDRWFVRDGYEYSVGPEIRTLVAFRHHNLVADPAPFGRDRSTDLTLCRNVTIYFARETTRALMGRLHASLRYGGYLFLGHSETLWQVSDDFRLVALGEAFVYRRDAPADVRGRQSLGGLRPDREPAAAASRRPRVPVPSADSARPGLTAPLGAPAPVPAAVPAAVRDPLAEARRALKAGDYQRAAELAAEVTASEPLLSDAYSVRGLALSNLGRNDDALVELRKAVYVDPQAGFAHFLLAGTLSTLGDTTGAARAYRAAAETLSASADDHVAAELGGRRVSELVDLCWQLSGGRR
ncbi:MAG TPA: CheR family methyltransferase [Mycobacteriales bacterium]|nr:CheR family methyltransferase [Mycobacteriales bacterium]